LFVTISTSQAPDSARRVGIEPATRRIFASASPANRWRSRPVLETSGEVTGDNGTGLSAEAVEDTLTAPVIPLPSSIVSPRIHRDITVVRVRSALDSRGNPLVIPTRFHAFPRPLQKRRSAVHRRGSVGAVASGRRRQCVRARCIARAKARFRARVSHEGSRVLRVTFARPRRAPKMRLLVTRTARQLYERIAAQPVIDSASLGREREREMEIEETPREARFQTKKNHRRPSAD
jgi:hypothetical protein